MLSLPLFCLSYRSVLNLSVSLSPSLPKVEKFFLFGMKVFFLVSFPLSKTKEASQTEMARVLSSFSFTLEKEKTKFLVSAVARLRSRPEKVLLVWGATSPTQGPG